MKNFTQDEQKQIIQLYKDNSDIEKIMNDLSSDEQSIRVILKNNNIDRKPTRFTEELDNRIAMLYQSGMTQKKICEQLLITEMGIKRALKRKGVSKRTSSECNRRFNRYSNYFDLIDTPNKAYILGLIYADGCNHVDTGCLIISLQEEDFYLLEKIKEELEYEGPLRFNNLNAKNPKYKNQYILRITDRHISDKLLQWGVVNSKSLTLTFPNFLSEELIPHFMRGYFDGDGCVYYDEKRNKCSTQTVGTNNFCNTLSSILKKINCKNSIKHPKQCKQETVILQTGGNKSTYLFLSWMYKDAELRLERKYQKYISFCEKYQSIKDLHRNNESVK